VTVLALLQMAVMADNPRMDLMYFLTGVMFAILPTTVLGFIGYSVVRDWYLHHYRRKVAPTPPPPAGR
jgi:hypothetical protein